MNQIEIFKSEEFGQIRTVVINDEPYFVGKDVAVALGYERATKAIQDHVDEEDKDAVPIQDSIGRMQKTPVINESGIFSLVLGSKLSSAKRFRRWVTKDVLPSIRKHGMYATDELLENPDLLIKVATALKEEKEKNKQLNEQVNIKNQLIGEMKPKAIFADAVAESSTTILIGELAKLIKQNGYDIGEKRLFTWLRDNGYLIKRKGTDYNTPTQRSMNLGLFEIKETAITRSSGSVTVSKTTKVTGKGQSYFINKFIA